MSTVWMCPLFNLEYASKKVEYDYNPQVSILLLHSLNLSVYQSLTNTQLYLGVEKNSNIKLIHN